MAAFYGLLTGLGIIFLTVLLVKYFSTKLMAATILCAIAFIYVGFSLQGNTVSYIILVVLVAALFYFLALMGYTKSPALIGYGTLLHGVWDVFHHHGFIIKASIPDYWPLYCLVTDLVTGIYFVMYFTRRKKEDQLNNVFLK
ncbi:DUF6010 family protein [Flavisolibacter tropicus]